MVWRLSSVLSTERAVAVNIEIMRAFVRMRSVLAANKELAQRFAELEARLDKKAAVQDKANNCNNVRDPGADESAHPTHARYWLHRQVRRIAAASQRMCAHNNGRRFLMAVPTP
jgi:hypothetical protein